MKPDSQPRRARAARMWSPYAVLVAVLAASALAALYVRASSEANDRLRFDNAVQRTHDAIRDRLETYADFLRAGAGLFAADREVSRDEFRRFVERVEVQKRYPGVQGVGFAARVRAPERAAFVDSVRRRFADYQLRPEGERDEYVPVTYLEPLDERNRSALGYDMFSESVRREAIERARDTGQAAASGRVTLVQEATEAQKQPGFLIYVPVYGGGDVPASVEARRESLRGFVYAPFRVDDLLGSIFGTIPYPLCDIAVYDGDSAAPENLMHRSDLARGEAVGNSYRPRFTATRTLDVEGHPWSIYFFTRPDSDIATRDWDSPLIALAGLLFGLVIFFSMRAQVRSRSASEAAAASLRASEARFRTLVEQSPISTQIFSPDGRTTRVNRAWEELWGVTLETLGDYNVLEDPQLEEKGVAPYIRRGFAGEATAIPPILYEPEKTIPGRSRHEDSRRWVSAVIYPVKDDEGRIREVVLMHEDISERVRAAEEREQLLERERAARAESEESLRVRRSVEERLRTLVDASRTLLSSPELGDVLPAILRLAGNLIAADAYAIWQYDFEGQSWAITAAEGLSDEYRQSLIAVTPRTPTMPERPLAFEDVYSEQMVGMRSELYRKEGIRSLLSLPLKVRGQVAGTLVFYYREPHRFDEAEVEVATALTNLAASAIGTSELYQAQRRSREEAESASRRSAFLAEATGVLASSLDFEQTLSSLAVLAVPHVADWCGVDVLDAAGKLRRLAVAHVDPQKIIWARELESRYPTDPSAEQGVPNVVRTGKSELYPEVSDEVLVSAAVDEEHLRILREIGFTSVMIVPLVARGRPLGAITFVTTAESGRRYGASDLAFAEDLAHRAALFVDNARLYKDAQEANRLKDEFLATLSHELRTPLTSVLGWAKLLRTERFDPETAARALEAIERNAEAQTSLINDLLDVSRIITGKLRLDVKPTELGRLVEAAVEGLRPAVYARGLRLDVRLDHSTGPVYGDADRLQQVVWNLLSNAIKFTPAGGRVEVILAREDGHAEVTVSDTGRGIAPEFLPHVFDRFRQADGAITREHGGLGLGLAIARHLVELHGGTITADSPGEGRGATFRVRLPLVGMRDADFGLQIEEKDSSHQSAVRHPQSEILKGLHVLVVDDDEDSRVLVSLALERSGARVTAAASAAEALERLKSLKPDVLIADIGMPGVDGYELMQRVRALGLGAGELPAAALTAYARPEDRERALASGFQAHVAKPVVPATLAETVARLAGRQK